MIYVSNQEHHFANFQWKILALQEQKEFSDTQSRNFKHVPNADYK